MKGKGIKRFRMPIAIIIFIIGLSLFLYPLLSDYWNRYRNKALIIDYQENIKNKDSESYKEMWNEAIEFNKNHQQNYIIDAFSSNVYYELSTPYKDYLNLNNNDIMGYITIPSIDVELIIFHGVEAKTLEEGVGHVEGTSLPIGGESTHSVLSAHSGLPSAKLFTDLDQLKINDQFYIHVLDKVFAYQVDQIETVLPKEIEIIDIEKGKDFVTLLTCTPYGVNTHRLCVRGKRVAYKEKKVDVKESNLVNQDNKYLKYKIITLTLTILLILKLIVVLKKNRQGGKKSE